MIEATIKYSDNSVEYVELVEWEPVGPGIDRYVENGSVTIPGAIVEVGLGTLTITLSTSEVFEKRQHPLGGE